MRPPQPYTRLLWRSALGLTVLTLATCLISGLANASPESDSTTEQSTQSHWPISPELAERAFTREPLLIISHEYAGRGMTGAEKIEVDLLTAGQHVTAKWKPIPRRLDAINNSPRRELAAYEVQKLFLDPADYVVPTSTLRCLAASDYQESETTVSPTLPETTCQIGVLSLWLDHVTLPDPLIDIERFSQDPVYARHLADFNLLTHLIQHKDGREGNFLVSKDDRHRRVFAIDNGVAFSGLAYNWFVPNWEKMRVPALRRGAIDRLRKVTEADVEALGVVAQLEIMQDGSVRVTPPTKNLDSDDGVRRNGRSIQFGLDDDEVEDLWERIEDLIQDVDHGRIAVF